MDQNAFHLLEEALPVNGIFSSSVPSTELEALGESLPGINTKAREAGVIASQVLVDQWRVDTLMFGILDDRNYQDQTMLLIIHDFDSPRDANGNIMGHDSGDMGEDAEGWYSLRICFQGRVAKFWLLPDKQSPRNEGQSGLL